MGSYRSYAPAAPAADWPDDPTQADRCLAALIEHGLVEPHDDGYALPA